MNISDEVSEAFLAEALEILSLLDDSTSQRLQQFIIQTEQAAVDLDFGFGTSYFGGTYYKQAQALTIDIRFIVLPEGTRKPLTSITADTKLSTFVERRVLRLRYGG
jgi:hypothetical protein